MAACIFITAGIEMILQSNHGRRMDDLYRYQRYIYDASRKFFLLGRDGLINEMNVLPQQNVLEIACGTGRNLAVLHSKYPDARLYGLDISEQMLLSARKTLGSHAQVAQADACNFDPDTLFGVRRFDHIMLSYCLSMIPDWTGAVHEAARHLAPGGRLHIVDFGDQSRLPNAFKRVLHRWLAAFYVTPRADLPTVMGEHFGRCGQLVEGPKFRGYAYQATWSSPTDNRNID
jgi:S-adenosylmethionine-diacylgycerolhomoserine-N-methlytransferase